MKYSILSILTISLLAISIRANAQETYVVKGFKMSVSGTSTLHEWESDITKVDAKGNLTVENSELKALNSLSVTIPAKSIVSTKGKIMDNKTHEALKADKHPNITFSLSSAQISGLNVTANGKLTIAGVTKNVKLNAKGKLDASGNITFSGSKDIVLTDYGMEPPTALMGSIKVGGQVNVKYELTLHATGVAGSTK
ncbi:MAG: YceI family protein [Phaeodactylibacter sp.]|nr:YceI family protein [Phaeodactylibacter sp.]MCB9274310.1 YceI family protein [Lewinellaceae bacterium]